MIPNNVAGWLWGWPGKFKKRMDRVNSEIFLLGDYNFENYSNGFNDPAEFKEFPEENSFSGGIWTDRLDLFAPIYTSYRPGQAD